MMNEMKIIWGEEAQKLLLDAKPGAAAFREANRTKFNIATAFRSMRWRSGLTQRQLSERSGLTQAVISRVETASGALPKVETLMRFAAACGRDLDLALSFASSNDGAAPTEAEHSVLQDGGRDPSCQEIRARLT